MSIPGLYSIVQVSLFGFNFNVMLFLRSSKIFELLGADAMSIWKNGLVIKLIQCVYLPGIVLHIFFLCDMHLFDFKSFPTIS